MDLFVERSNSSVELIRRLTGFTGLASGPWPRAHPLVLSDQSVPKRVRRQTDSTPASREVKELWAGWAAPAGAASWFGWRPVRWDDLTVWARTSEAEVEGPSRANRT